MRRFLPSLSALQAFEAAARHLSFTKAGEDLSLTQSGISRQIANLESHLGLRLFDRSGSRLVLTDAGAAYFQDIKHVLDKLEAVSTDLVRGWKLDASLMIGTHPTFAARWLAPRLPDFMQRHPEVQVEIAPIGFDLDLAETRIDVAILRGSGSWRGARCEELFPEELSVVASPQVMPTDEARRQIDFTAQPTLQNSSRPRLWLQWLRASGLQHTGTIQGVRFPHSEMLIRAAVSGLGLAVVPDLYVEQEIARGELHRPFGAPVRSGLSFWLAVPERKMQRRDVGLFRHWLLRQARSARLRTYEAPGATQGV